MNVNKVKSGQTVKSVKVNGGTVRYRSPNGYAVTDESGDAVLFSTSAYPNIVQWAIFGTKKEALSMASKLQSGSYIIY